jgi:selenium metabolism protein YedF
MDEKLNLRGLACPEPVIATKRVLDRDEIESVEVLVDDEICVANLERLARSFRAFCAVESREGFFKVIISKSEPQSSNAAPALSSAEPQDAGKVATVVFIAKEALGDGNVEFSKTLANVFLQTLYEAGHRPRAILLANSGVKLMKTDSTARKVLADFKAAGCEVLCCGLCVEYYELTDDIKKEQITNMFAICEYLCAAEKVIQF